MKKAFLYLLAVTLLGSTGCVSRAISEGIEKVLGPTPYSLMVQPPAWPADDPTFLASYRNFELAPLKNEFPDTPPAFMEYFPVKFAEQLAGKDLPHDPKGKTLLVSVTVLGYQAASSFHKALGPTEEVIARVDLVDKATNNLVGRAICIGRTFQSVGLGPKWKAWGLARAIVNDWISKSYPKEGRHEVEEGKEQAPPSDQ